MYQDPLRSGAERVCLRLSRWTGLDWQRSWPLLLGLAAVLAVFVMTYLGHPDRPTAPELGNGWWAWSDQGRYYVAARAWAHGDLAPAHHWYLPGYPLIGAAFYWLWPTDPFAVPDALLLALALFLFVRICEALDIKQYWAVALFLLSTVAPSRIFDEYLNPWTTTPVVPLIFGTLLAAVRYADGGGRKYAVIAGACAGLIPLFRPSDLIVAAPAIIFSAIQAWRAGGLRQVLTASYAFVGGFILTGACSAAFYLAIYGPELSSYLRQEENNGFQFLRLASKWAEIFGNPRPLYVEGEGILEAYPWVALGFLGVAQSAFLRRCMARRLVAVTVTVYIALYLSYGSLLAYGLWRGNNLHYFKWTFPILAMLGFLALKSLRRRENWPGFAAALAISAVPLCLQMTTVPGGSATVSRVGNSEFIMSFTDPPQPVDAIDIPLATGGLDQLTEVPAHRVWVDGEPRFVWGIHTAFGSRVGLWRPASAKQLRIQLEEGYSLSPDREPTPISRRLTMGWPDWLIPRSHAREFAVPAGAPNYHPGTTLEVSKRGGRQPTLLLTSGWSDPEDWVRWSDGPRSEIAFALDPGDLGSARSLHFVMSTGAYVPPGKPPLRISLSANGVAVTEWEFAGPTGKVEEFSADIPRALVDPQGMLRLSLVFHDPLSPLSAGLGPDTRLLGIELHSIRLDAPQ